MTCNRIALEKSYTYGDLLKKRRVNFENENVQSLKQSQMQSLLRSSDRSSSSNSVYSELGKNDLHKKIMEIGDHLHEEIVTNLRLDYKQRFKFKERELFESFKKEKIDFYNKEKSNYEAKYEQIKMSLKKEYEKLLQEKIMETKTYYEISSREKIENCKIEFKKELQDSIIQMNEDFKTEKASAIEQELKKYEKIAREALDKQKQFYDEKIARLNISWEAKLEASKCELSQELNEKFAKDLQIREAQVEARKTAELDQLKCRSEKLLKLKETELHKMNESYKQLEAQLEDAKRENSILKKRVDDIRAEFQACIQRFSRLRKEESDFLFPLEFK